MSKPVEQLLTPAEKILLRNHTLSHDDVYDGRNETYAEFKEGARSAGKELVLRAESNRHCGHRLVTHAGHCIICNPVSLERQRGTYRTGKVYIAASQRLRLTKIGLSQEPQARVWQMNGNLAYGGTTDWTQLFEVKALNAGQIEQSCHTSLTAYRVPTAYSKDGREQISRELFSCNFSVCFETVYHEMQKLKIRPIGQAWRSKRYRDFTW